jgi:type IV secretory pathway TraG/TraD family ATPase VirD4
MGSPRRSECRRCARRSRRFAGAPQHREKTSHSQLVGAILHILYAETDKTLAGVCAFLSHPKRPIETTLTLI